MSFMNRMDFIKGTLLSSAGLILLPSVIYGQQIQQQGPQPPRPQRGPALNPEHVKEFVGAAHRDMNKVKEMYEGNPDLLNSVNNLGSWDWEDAIGAAGHVGDRELALYLLEKGARPTICVCAMLGKLEVVKTFIQAFPSMKSAVGPHKISLLRHAKAGGEEAKNVLAYLQSIGSPE